MGRWVGLFACKITRLEKEVARYKAKYGELDDDDDDDDDDDNDDGEQRYIPMNSEYITGQQC